MVREGDYVIRFGGDEFLIILHECKEDSAIIITERILNKLRSIEALILPLSFPMEFRKLAVRRICMKL